MSEQETQSGKPQTDASAPRLDKPPALEIRQCAYYSRALGRNQQYGCWLPDDAGRGERRYPLMILLHGLNGDWRDWSQYSRIARHLAGQDIIVACPDGGNGWYTNAVNGGERYEDDIMGGLLPHLEASLPILPGSARAIGGLSMGGYGAVKLALKYPREFRIAVSHSGAFDVTSRAQDHPVFGHVERDASFRRGEDLFWLAEQALCQLPTERPEICLDCGASDSLAEVNRRFSDHLNFIGYGHSYREMPGHHTWPYWDRAFRTILPIVRKQLCSRSPDRALAHDGDSHAGAI